MLYDHYVKKYSHDPIQTCGVHLLHKCSKLIRFWATLIQFWPSSGHKLTENGGFGPLTEKLFTQPNSNLVCALIGWVFKINLLFRPRCPKFVPLVTTKWLKMMSFDHYLRKYNSNLVSTLSENVGSTYQWLWSLAPGNTLWSPVPGLVPNSVISYLSLAFSARGDTRSFLLNSLEQLSHLTVWLNFENVLLTFKWYVFMWQKSSMLTEYANGHFFNKWNCVSMP